MQIKKEVWRWEVACMGKGLVSLSQWDIEKVYWKSSRKDVNLIKKKDAYKELNLFLPFCLGHCVAAYIFLKML